MWDWLRGPKKTAAEKRQETEHPFDRAARETNDSLASFRETSKDLQEEEDRREAFKRIKD